MAQELGKPIPFGEELGFHLSPAWSVEGHCVVCASACLWQPFPKPQTLSSAGYLCLNCYIVQPNLEGGRGWRVQMGAAGPEF